MHKTPQPITLFILIYRYLLFYFRFLSFTWFLVFDYRLTKMMMCFQSFFNNKMNSVCFHFDLGFFFGFCFFFINVYGFFFHCWPFIWVDWVDFCLWRCWYDKYGLKKKIDWIMKIFAEKNLKAEIGMMFFWSTALDNLEKCSQTKFG